MSYERWKIFSMNFRVHVDLLLIFYVRRKLELHHWTLLSTLVGINKEFKIPETKKFWNIKKSSDKNAINTGLSLAIFCHWMHILSIAWNAYTTNHVCQLAHRLFLHFFLSSVARSSMGSKKKHEWMSQMSAIQRDSIESFFFLIHTVSPHESHRCFCGSRVLNSNEPKTSQKKQTADAIHSLTWLSIVSDGMIKKILYDFDHVFES